MSRPRSRSYNTAKLTVTGNRVQQAPAWKQKNLEGIQTSSITSGSKILLSQLPEDVTEAEIEDLLSSTIGPLHDVFIVYNAVGRPKGMAVAHFKRVADAIVARQKYNGRMIDGRRSIKIELILDRETEQVTSPRKPLSLLERLGTPGVATTGAKPNPLATQKSANLPIQTTQSRKHAMAKPRRVKKGPKRINKQQKTAQDLDRELDMYRNDSSTGIPAR
ncbi:hypothetical protein SISNIDRAFT_482838 [Sistotremastrum niveocremeum HHB9708]|uniref:RRM domain-containing protein n=2 Tax=Sistotremastraceae TaxID=3402574 RepID=A0A164XSL3_9AGAM|nr:hypothetical protein SISNIDRAFT_482838 [Sistotremastrum niveocremeum HHB9708]KZT34775.1 hypothetical protein SISSUDRAFT_1065038 [Sistotremastrum suecicum HHB10207 ss-3]